MKSELEIARAHDILLAALNGEIGQMPDEASENALQGALDVLCWVLGHEHNQNFAANLATLHAFIEARGYRLVGPRVN